MKFKLPENIDLSGRWLRFLIGILLLIAAYWQESWLLLLCALFTLFEAVMSWCVVYHILGKSSCPVKQKK